MSKRILKGVVISDSTKRDKTVAVSIVGRIMHPKYKKYINIKKKYHAHDENNVCKIGDVVEICESRPISKTKCWVVLDKNCS